jgi:hypothetical protein
MPGAVRGNIQREQTEEKSLQVIIGAQLSAVTFVQDYIQLHFDGPRLTVFSHPVVIRGDQTFHWGNPGFRDALCSGIAQQVTAARIAYSESICIEFADGSAIKIALKDADYLGAEAVSFDTGKDEWWSL